MDVHVIVSGIFFVWDSDKAKSNAAKHGVSFDVAATVFSDPLAQYEDASVPDESRMSVVGQGIKSAVLYVVHVVREDDRVRIISARMAEARERRDYEEFG